MTQALLSPISRSVIAALEDLEARPLSDVLLFPVQGDGRRQWNCYSCITTVWWRNSMQDFYLRTNSVPYDIIPLRPRDPQRRGLWYSIGPGFTADGLAMANGNVLHIQAEGDAVEATADAVRDALHPWADGLVESFERPDNAEWERYCASIELP